MWKHNIILTFRNFKRNKTSFLINLIGLSTGLACALLIYMWVNDEMNMDKFHKQDEQLFQIVQNYERTEGIKSRAITPAYFAKEIKEALPEVVYAIPTNNEYNFTQPGIVAIGEKQVKAQPIFAGKDYFHIFSFPLLEGNKDQVLADKNLVVISEGLAEKIFNTTENAVGKMIRWEHDVFENEFIVSGVFKNLPTNSTEQFDIVLNFENALDPYEESRNWNTDAARTFFILKKGTDLEQFNKKLTAVLHAKPHRENCSVFAQQFSTIYLHGEYENGKIAGGRIAYIKLFSLIALFILIIACVNFMNLSTARASTRMKEVGVKKATGASRGNLINQFLGESILMVSLSFLASIFMISMSFPQFNEITGKELDLNMDSQTLISMLGIVLITGIIAGSYPAFYLSGFKPASVLKGKLQISFGEKWIRKGLVVFQFGLSFIFIISFLIINRQIDFIQQKKLGYDKNNIVCFTSKGQASQDLPIFLEQIKKIPEVLSATNIEGGRYVGNKNFGTAPTWDGVPVTQQIRVPRPHVGYDYLKTLGIELIEGRSFSKEFNEEDNVIINESAAKLIGYENPVGKYLNRGPNYKIQIIGVVKDFHNESLHHKISPTFIRFSPTGKDIMVKIKAGENQATIQKLKESYEKFHAGFPFEFTFMDDDFQKMYDSENRVAALSDYFAGIAIIISCLGLFGLAMFTTERRRKEIGIRKVLGSSVFGIVKMLTSDFTKIVIVAISISIPISYLIAQKWLNNFAYNITLTWWLFFIPALLVLIIAWATVGLQTVKAASVNPVESLKDE